MIWKVSRRTGKFLDDLLHKILQNHLYAHLSRIWKLMRFIRKVFTTKILLSGKFSLFVTLLLSLQSPTGGILWLFLVINKTWSSLSCKTRAMSSPQKVINRIMYQTRLTHKQALTGSQHPFLSRTFSITHRVLFWSWEWSWQFSFVTLSFLHLRITHFEASLNISMLISQGDQDLPRLVSNLWNEQECIFFLISRELLRLRFKNADGKSKM